MLIGADQDTFLGCNFHYLNPRFRAILLDKLTAKVGEGMPNWSKLSKIREIAPISSAGNYITSYYIFFQIF